MGVLEETGALFMMVASVLVGMGQNAYLGPMVFASRLPVMLGYNTLVL